MYRKDGTNLLLLGTSFQTDTIHAKDLVTRL